MGQTNVHRYLPRLLEFIERGKIDPSFVISHSLALDETADGYKTFHDEVMASTTRGSFAGVTGASSGIGLEPAYRIASAFLSAASA